MFKRNDSMEFIFIGEGELTVFNPETGDTHFLDETGSAIVSRLEAPVEFDALLRGLSEEYEGEPAEMEADVREFLDVLLEKGVVVRV